MPQTGRDGMSLEVFGTLQGVLEGPLRVCVSEGMGAKFAYTIGSQSTPFSQTGGTFRSSN